MDTTGDHVDDIDTQFRYTATRAEYAAVFERALDTADSTRDYTFNEGTSIDAIYA